MREAGDRLSGLLKSVRLPDLHFTGLRVTLEEGDHVRIGPIRWRFLDRGSPSLCRGGDVVPRRWFAIFAHELPLLDGSSDLLKEPGLGADEFSEWSFGGPALEAQHQTKAERLRQSLEGVH